MIAIFWLVLIIITILTSITTISFVISLKKDREMNTELKTLIIKAKSEIIEKDERYTNKPIFIQRVGRKFPSLSYSQTNRKVLPNPLSLELLHYDISEGKKIKIDYPKSDRRVYKGEIAVIEKTQIDSILPSKKIKRISKSSKDLIEKRQNEQLINEIEKTKDIMFQ